MKTDRYIEALREAKVEMADLLRQREEINARLTRLAPVVDHLATLCGETLDPKLEDYGIQGLGLSDAIRFILSNSYAEVLVPTEIRDRLSDMGFDLDKYENVMPPIHNTLKRLMSYNEIEGTLKNGKTGYRLISPLQRIFSPGNLMQPSRAKAFGGGKK